ncbi:MAG: pyruvate carboxylase [Streblomastix strix]|uniref:acetyl-CoA carboxytransferase n=1 Tax=Streblomastix strix TaxID=222440 RepID=A0A5J4WGC6_9EUKA|nr:MAG: pyruvate carboxylase [Streblomastix strix]
MVLLGHTNRYAVVVNGTVKGHSEADFASAGYGMATPSGYRTALKLFNFAERFSLAVVTLVDTVGAEPSFSAERAGQSEAIAGNLQKMASLRVPIISIIVGEGGSGGALGLMMGNSVGMLSCGWYGVISPEGAASILGRYKDDSHKKIQFPKDCAELAHVQQIYVDQLLKKKVIDGIIWEEEDVVKSRENYTSFPQLN